MKKYKKEVAKNKKLYNEIQELKGNIRVYCRVRPLNADEVAHGETFIASFLDEDTVAITNQQGVKKVFEFDRVFGPNSTQGKYLHLL